MMAELDAETRQLVDIAVAGAPALTTEQITELRRVLKPETRLRPLAPVAALPRPAKTTRRAA